MFASQRILKRSGMAVRLVNDQRARIRSCCGESFIYWNCPGSRHEQTTPNFETLYRYRDIFHEPRSTSDTSENVEIIAKLSTYRIDYVNSSLCFIFLQRRESITVGFSQPYGFHANVGLRHRQSARRRESKSIRTSSVTPPCQFYAFSSFETAYNGTIIEPGLSISMRFVDALLQHSQLKESILHSVPLARTLPLWRMSPERWIALLMPPDMTVFVLLCRSLYRVRFLLYIFFCSR